jgi:hypothetical protein
MERAPSSSNVGSHAAGKTVFTDQTGRKHILCHRCGVRKPKSNYYDTCHKGKDCEQLVGPSRLTQLDQPVKRILVHTAENQLQLDHSFTSSMVGPEQDSTQAGDKKQTAEEQAGRALFKSTTQQASGQVENVEVPCSLAEVDIRVLSRDTECKSPDFPMSSCEDVPQMLDTFNDQRVTDPNSESDESQASDSEGDSKPDSDLEDNDSKEVQELAMKLLRNFQELGDEGLIDGLDISEDDEEEEAEILRKRSEEAAANLQKLLHRGELGEVADDEIDTGDDWLDELVDEEVRCT